MSEGEDERAHVFGCVGLSEVCVWIYPCEVCVSVCMRCVVLI